MSAPDRTWAFDVLMNCPALLSHVNNRIFAASSLGIDPKEKPPARPFLVYRAGLALPSMKHKTKVVPYVFYVHDEQGSYLNHIEPSLEAIKLEFKNRAPEFWDGKQIFEANWRDDSEDLYDDMFRTAVKYTTIDVTVSS